MYIFLFYYCDKQLKKLNIDRLILICVIIQFNVTMSRKFPLLVLLLNLYNNICGVSCLGINNFHFPLGNVFHGKHPQSYITVSGTYKMFKDDYPDHSIETKQLIDKGGRVWMCKNQSFISQALNLHYTPDQLTMFTENLDKFSKERTVNDMQIPMDADKKCSVFNLTATNDPNTFAFDLFFKTENYGPIVFLDYFGMGTFNYISSISKVKNQYQNGKVIRFCGNYKYSGFLYSLAPRPICPAHSPKFTEVSYGKITIYKKNIIAYHIPAHLCTLTRVWVESRTDWKNSCYGNYPGITEKAPGDLNSCYDTPERIAHYKNAKPDGDLNTFTDDLEQWLWCGPTPKRCRSWIENKTFEDPRTYFDYEGFSDRPNHFRKEGETWTYGRKNFWKCDYWSDQAHYYYHANILPINVTVIMPDYHVNIPTMGFVSRDDLAKGHHSSPIHGTVVWEEQAINQLCKYVPRLEANVQTIKYLATDILGGLKNSKSMTYYINDDLRAAISTTEDMIVEDPKFNCIKHSKGDKIYLLNTHEIMVFTEMTQKEYMDAIRNKGSVKHHPHSFVNQASTYLKNESQTYDISIVYGGDDDVGHDHNNIDHIGQPPNKIVTAIEASDYIQFETEMERRRNLHIRTMQNCHMNEQIWDNFNQLLSIDPSVALTQKLNTPLQATQGGNNFYNIRKCELVTIHKVLESLFINDTTVIDLGNVTTTISDLVKKKGINNPRPDVCLSYPFIVFSTLAEPKTRLLGQLTFSGIIEFTRVTNFVVCDSAKNYAFSIYNKTYMYENYRLKNVINTEDIGKQAHEDKNATIRYLDISYHGAQETVNLYLPSQLTARLEYTIEEQQSAAISISEVLQETNKIKFEERLDTHDGDYISHNDGFFSGLGSLGDIFSGFVDAVKDGLDAVGHIPSLGSSIMDGILSFLTPLLTGAITIIIIFAIAQLVYKKVLLNE